MRCVSLFISLVFLAVFLFAAMDSSKCTSILQMFFIAEEILKAIFESTP